MHIKINLTIISTLLASMLSIPLNGMTHPFYISVCEIEHNPDTDALEITFKIFTEDLEQVLEAQGTGKLNLGTDHESENADRYITRYLEQHVFVEVDGRTLKAEFLGKESEVDAIWCYVEIKDVPSINTIAVTNTLLIDLFEDQTNMVHIKANGQKKSMLFTRVLDRDTVTF